MNIDEIGNTVSSNPVNHPDHYNAGKVECIVAIESACVGLDGFEGLCAGTAIKYMWRWKKKGKPIEDIKKSIWYLERLVNYLEANTANTLHK